jgi:hypothetical protein
MIAGTMTLCVCGRGFGELWRRALLLNAHSASAGDDDVAESYPYSCCITTETQPFCNNLAIVGNYYYCAYVGKKTAVKNMYMCSMDQTPYCTGDPVVPPCDTGTYQYPECPQRCYWNINIRSSSSYSKAFAVLIAAVTALCADMR